MTKKYLNGKEFKVNHPTCRQFTEQCYSPDRISDTLEYLLADYAASRFAKAMGKDEDAGIFEARARKYKDNYNPLLGFMAPRKENGKFRWMWGRYDDNYCVESNIFQQSWFVPYDVKGLAELFGRKRNDLLGASLYAQAAAFAPIRTECYVCHIYYLLFIPKGGGCPAFGRVNRNISPAIAGGKRERVFRPIHLQPLL